MPRLPSIFDHAPASVSLDDLELAMDDDMCARSLAAVTRGLSPAAFYDPDQPRDHGKWSKSSESGPVGSDGTPSDTFAPPRGAGTGANVTPTPAPEKEVRGLPKGATASLDATTKAWAASLAEYPRMAIAGYTGSLYEQINKSLQSSPGDLSAMPEGTRHNVRAIDAAIRAYPPHEVLTSYRGVRSRFPEKIAKLEEGLKAAIASGEPVKLDGFTSSSLDPFVGIGWGAVTLEIVSPRGAYVGAESERPTEKEILHTHGDRFKVTAYRDGKYVLSNGAEIRRKTYTLEAIPEPPEPLPPPKPGAEFDFDPALHPHGEHGRWTTSSGVESSPAGSAKSPHQPLKLSDVPERILKDAEKFLSSINPWEKGNLSWYTAENYQQVNTPLRECPQTLDCLPERDRERAVNIDSAIRKFPAQNPPLTSYRGLSIKSPEKRAKLLASFKDAAASGEPVTLNGFSSATLDPVKAAGWGQMVLEIRSPRGAYINRISNHPTKMEVLHNHGERYRVKSITDQYYEVPRNSYDDSTDPLPPPRLKTTIVLEAVEEPPPPIRKPAEFGEFDPSLHPHGEHGRWASVKAEESAAISPSVATIPPSVAESTFLVSRDEKSLPPAVVQSGERWTASLNPEELKSLRAYTDKNYKGINSALRLHPDLNDPKIGVRVRKWAKMLAASLDKCPPLDKPLTSYRGVASSTQAKQLAIKAAFNEARMSGATVTLNGFSSATLNPALAGSWVAKRKEDGFVLEIKSRRGVYVAGGSDNPQELEVLHNHGTKYKVTGVRTVEYREQGKTHWPKLTTFTLEHVEDGAEFASTLIPAGAIRVKCPKLCQDDDYTCGVVLLEAFARHFNVAPDDTRVHVREWFKTKLKPSPEYGTSPDSLIELAGELGLNPVVFHPMSVAEVKAALDAEKPVVCCVQAWGDPGKYAESGSGHYIGAIGYDKYMVYFEDPSLDQRRGYMTWGEFVDRWHDADGDGNEYRQWGMTLWKDESIATEIE